MRAGLVVYMYMYGLRSLVWGIGVVYYLLLQRAPAAAPHDPPACPHDRHHFLLAPLKCGGGRQPELPCVIGWACVFVVGLKIMVIEPRCDPTLSM